MFLEIEKVLGSSLIVFPSESLQIISEKSHFLDFAITFESLLSCLRLFGVVWNGEQLECKNSKIKVSGPILV